MAETKTQKLKHFEQKKSEYMKELAVIATQESIQTKMFKLDFGFGPKRNEKPHNLKRLAARRRAITKMIKMYERKIEGLTSEVKINN